MLAPLRPALLLAAFLSQTTPPPSAPAPSDAAVEKAQIANGSLHPPVLVSQVNPDYSEQARKKKIRGDVQMSLIIDTAGVPQDVTVIHGLGGGLDEKAVEAVKQYRFRPATRDGHPVPMKLHINVNFQIF